MKESISKEFVVTLEHLLDGLSLAETVTVILDAVNHQLPTINIAVRVKADAAFVTQDGELKPSRRA